MLATKSNITPDKFEALMQQKYNRKSFRGLELLNAAGDINPNGLAFQYTLDRLTYIRSGMVEQTFYEVSPAVKLLSLIPRIKSAPISKLVRLIQHALTPV